MKKNFKGEARKARRVSMFLAYSRNWTREELEESRVLFKVERNPYVRRHRDSEYYTDLQEYKERSFWKGQEETTTPQHLREQVEGLSKAIRAKEIALRALEKDIKELCSKKEDLLFILRSL